MRRERERGESLVAIVVAVGILGIMGVIGMRACSNGLGAANSLALRGDAGQLTAMLSDLVSCANTFDPAVNPTFNPATCNETTPVDVYSINSTSPPRLLVSRSNTAPTRAGKLMLRATCSTDPAKPGFIFKAAHVKQGATAPLTSTAAANFLPDPLTSKTVTWADSATDLFLDGARLCARNFIGLPACSEVSGGGPCYSSFIAPYAGRCPNDRAGSIVTVHNSGTAAALVRLSGSLRGDWGSGGCGQTPASPVVLSGNPSWPVAALAGGAAAAPANKVRLPPDASVLYMLSTAGPALSGRVSGKLEIWGASEGIDASGVIWNVEDSLGANNIMVSASYEVKHAASF